MKQWENFELQCVRYLNEKFGEYAEFIHQGGADSTVPDILVRTKHGASFYMEAKHSPAQCGQFVLLPDLETEMFVYSPLNATQINQSVRLIMDYMNRDFGGFREAGTAGREIAMQDGPAVFSEWIIQTYREKDVAFFITNGNTILPIAQFRDYFDVTAKYRIKKSGSQNVGKNNLQSVLDHIINRGYDIENARNDNGKLFLESPNNLNRQRFVLGGTEYMFSRRENEYEVRKLSNTRNANVIFSIQYRAGKSGINDSDFIRCLE